MILEEAKAKIGFRETLQMCFDDNSLLLALFGAHDRHIARVEQKLGILVSVRGNEVSISGGREAVNITRAVLSDLYSYLKKGQNVSIAEVDAAIRMHNSNEKADLSVAQREEIKTRKKSIKPRSPNQIDYIRALRDVDLTFALGPAGTGKTYLAVAMAVSLFIKGEIERIILSRPAVEAGEHLGFLPGDIREKVDPYLRPLYDALYDMLPSEQVARKIESGEIEIAPLAFMRGRTLSNAYIILDEAQNTTPMQMKMFLTRLGENSRMVVTGDLSQIDLRAGMKSGLYDAVNILKNIQRTKMVNFSDIDVVRNPLVTRIVRAYDQYEAQNNHE